MTDLGTYMLGDRVCLGIQCEVSRNRPTLPDAAPAAIVYAPDGSALLTYQLPPVDPTGAPGFFTRSIHLDRRYNVGHYQVHIAYTVSGAARCHSQRFEVVAGGHGDGAAIAGYHYHRPHAEYQVLQLDSGKLYRGRNPYV
jgi:hypothetical protein